MQTWTATISALDPIPGKDRIVLATVNGYQAIVPAGLYNLGDTVVYISEQSILAPELQEELGLVGRLGGRSKDRVKAIRMGGVLSQGIVCKPFAWQVAGCPEGDLDEFFAETITKWEPEIPMHMSGKIGRPRGNAPIAPMYDIENIKKQRHLRFDYDTRGNQIEGSEYWHDPFNGQLVTITEKLHGTNFAVHKNANDPNIYVYSKGLGKQGHILLEDETNVYWRALRMYPEIEVFMEERLAYKPNAAAITVRGEIVGEGIQDLTYGQKFNLALFSIEYHFGDGSVITEHPDQWTRLMDVPNIPVLYEGLYDYDLAVKLSVGQNLWGIPNLHVREGVVVAHRHTYRQMNGLRYAAKFINPDYLTRKGGTEFN